MKQSKVMTGVEAASATSLLVSKYFLAINSVWGWVLAIVGYFLAGIYNASKGLKILAVVVIGLMLLSAYGWYKWATHMSGLQVFDIVVICGTVVFGGAIAFYQYRHRRPLWKVETAINILCMAAYVLLGLGSDWGWVCLIGAHIGLAYLYMIKHGYIFVGQQIISICIAVFKLIDWL